MIIYLSMCVWGSLPCQVAGWSPVDARLGRRRGGDKEVFGIKGCHYRGLTNY